MSEIGLHVTHSANKSWTVRNVQPVEYDVVLCDDVLDPANQAILPVPAQGRARRLVVVDANVDALFGQAIRAYFDGNDVEHRVLVLEPGEINKTVEASIRVTTAMDDFGVDRRREPVIAIGGGVLLDVVGYACSIYRRATPFVRVPTTLIGLVDAGVGVKTGVNANGHKNRLGTYFAAERTLLDRKFLTTLPRRHVSNGLAEILKIALIKDRELFDLMEATGEHVLEAKMQRGPGSVDPALEIIDRAIHGMLTELQPNLWEKTLERVVDYGHTFSPSLEMVALPALLHGEAVCIDMALTTCLGEQRGLVTEEERRRVLELMTRLELPTWHPLLTTDLLQRALADTVRHRDGQQRLPLPVGIGSACFVNDVSPQELADAAAALEAFELAQESAVRA
ncbi:sedoheptulose 7-phosphate cyclase [Lentzea aerocolonigenes]|uniref:sedoheptulose 7-phosphate cyclase n=1 Tax=Lentzea aerocolonigenes TaxID=68170 RepID=UPI0004C30E24|nr:sedoheptulose 7-phosphate cyclase [Lentzea aerocolonigenes]MCP2243642.1 3-dehydroquinate synthase [Lentzea aerocolonigenes]